MKKRLLFIVSNMESGGVSKSMTSLLNVVDTDEYEVDCFVLNPRGVFLSSIPSAIHMISDERTSLLFSKFPQNLILLAKKGWFWDAFIRVLVAFFMLFNKGIGGWLLSRRVYRIPKQYDLAVDYNGQHQLYYLIDYVSATKKVTFFHSDYEKWPYYYRMDRKYFPLVDQIFTISNQCVSSLKKFFPVQENKIDLFENISAIQQIYQMANQSISDPVDTSILSFISIGHLSPNKGTHLAFEVAHLLKKKGISFKWYFLGENQDKATYNQLKKDYNIEDCIVELGVKANPYPYIKQATIVVHLSKFEGKSIALDEAKILCKPIVVSNFSTVTDQFQDGYNATIVPFNAETIADTLLQLANDPILQSKYIGNLKNTVSDNTQEIQKLYHLIH